MAAEPSAQERVTAKATPAEAMACTKADSRVAVERGVRRAGRRGRAGLWGEVLVPRGPKEEGELPQKKPTKDQGTQEVMLNSTGCGEV